MFTAALVFQFVEEGKLKLSDTLDKFFPQIPNAKKITIAHILAHRSGIHNFTKEPDFRSWSLSARTKDETLAFIAKGAPEFEPGEKRSYSNAGYVLLGYVVEKLAGKPYRDVLKERITGKLGLKDTYLGTGKTDVSKKESFSYKYSGDWKQQDEIDLSVPGGAGAIVSTPSDLVKFIQALFDGKLISQENVNQMKSGQPGIYGMGMSEQKLGGKTIYGNSGGTDGFSSTVFYLPEEKLAVAYTANAKVYSHGKIFSGIIDIYYNKPFEIPTFESIAVSPEVLDKYLGVYSSPGAPGKFTITREGATLHAQPTGQSSVPLEATAQDKFKFDPVGVVMEFDAAKNQMILKRSGRETVFTKEH
jgi:CubicO group peptidase (beta-lactamase class C family)